MTNKTNEPDLVNQYVKSLKNKLFLWFKKQSIVVKVIAGVIGLIIAIFLGSHGYFGENTQSLIKDVCPQTKIDSTDILSPQEIKRKKIDSLYNVIKRRNDSIKKAKNDIGKIKNLKEESRTEIQVSYASIFPDIISKSIFKNTFFLDYKKQLQGLFKMNLIPQEKMFALIPQITFTINSQRGYNMGNYKDGDEIELFLTLNQPCFVVLMHINAKGSYYIRNKQMEYFDKMENTSIGSLLIDDTEGFELYYAFVSYDSINLTKLDLLINEKQQSIKNVQTKGEKDEFFIKLGSDVVSDHLYFYSN